MIRRHGLENNIKMDLREVGIESELVLFAKYN
jgi:hypothetical protein